jgi:hypothetical protein
MYFRRLFIRNNNTEKDSQEIKLDNNINLNKNNYYLNIYINTYINNSEEDECLICLGTNTICNKIIKIKNNKNFISICNCDGNYHMKCLLQWLNKNKMCPICRQTLIINTENNICIKIYNNCKKYSHITCKIFYNIIIFTIKIILWFTLVNYIILIMINLIFGI